MTIFPSLLLVITSLFCSQDYWKADKYTERNQLQHQWAENFFFSRYAFKGDEKILDLGCGDGSLTKRISNSTKGKTWGMDSSPSMIRFAKTYYGSHRLQFWLSSAEDPNVYEKLRDTIDLVVSFHCLHWVKDHDMVLGGIYSILTPGGKAFLRFCSDGFDPIQAIADEMKGSEKWKKDFDSFVDPMQRFGVEKYREKLKEHQFKIIDIHEFVGADILENKEELEAHIKGWLPHCKFLAKEKRDLFVHDLIGTYMSRYPVNENGKIELPDCYLEVEIQKAE